ncbi:MAG: DUF3237 domain-containing protein [Acidobacteria bacterium]|nr:DUF3237 domain-containing protein [Acidobacteriota bacterium]
MHLVPLLTLRINTQTPIPAGPGPFGTRIVSNAVSGTFEGPRLRGKVLEGGGDWALSDGEGGLRLDVRLLLETDDGARIYVQYTGVLVMNEKTEQALQGHGDTEFADTYFMTQPRFETGDPRYRWLNRVVAIGEGRIPAGAVEYIIYEAVN